MVCVNYAVEVWLRPICVLRDELAWDVMLERCTIECRAAATLVP